MKSSLLLLACVLTFSGCKIVDVPEFVHPATDGVREGLEWGSPSPRFRSGTEIGDTPLLVPDFTKFWPGYSPTGFIYICSPSGTAIEIESVVLSAPDTGEKKELLLERVLTPEPLSDDVWLARDRIVEHGAVRMDEFVHAKLLVVIVRWRVVGTSLTQESRFEFELRTRKDVAWPT
jgi:hypothetical protein